MKTNNSIDNNSGFTLVELIVSMAILVIVGAAIIAFFSMSMIQYKNNTNETNVQTESRMAWKRLESNILKTDKGIWVPNAQEIWLFNVDSDDNRTMTRIYYVSPTTSSSAEDSADETTDTASVIRYQEYNLNGITGDITLENLESVPTIGESQLFANFVTEFSLQLYDKSATKASKGEKAAKLVANISYKANERTFSSENIVAMRNDIIASNNIEQIYK